MKASKRQPAAAPVQAVELEDAADLSEPITTITPRIAAIIALIAQANDGELAAIEAAAVAIVGRQAAASPEALPAAGVACLDLLASRPPWRGTTLAEMSEAIFSATRTNWSEASIRRHLLPAMRTWGIQSKARIGYYWPANCRMIHMQHQMHAPHATVTNS